MIYRSNQSCVLLSPRVYSQHISSFDYVITNVCLSLLVHLSMCFSKSLFLPPRMDSQHISSFDYVITTVNLYLLVNLSVYYCLLECIPNAQVRLTM